MSDREMTAEIAVAPSPLSREPVTDGGVMHCGTVDRSGQYRTKAGNEFPPKEALHRNPSKNEANPGKILTSFNARKFRREQPGDPHLMLQFISRAIDEPVPFIMYWGKGPRATLADPDIECIEFLNAMTRQVRDAYPPGARLKLIFTDTHAALNGHSQADIRSYFGEIDVCARGRGFDTCWLGDLVRAAGSELGPIDHDMPQDMASRLTASARKWYRGEGTIERGALKYYQANMLEKRVVERAFPDSIMITFNSSALRSLLPPHLPVFYMYSMRRGFSVKPWFISPDSPP